MNFTKEELDAWRKVDEYRITVHLAATAFIIDVPGLHFEDVAKKEFARIDAFYRQQTGEEPREKFDTTKLKNWNGKRD